MSHTKNQSAIIKAKRPFTWTVRKAASFELAFAWKVFCQILAGNRALYFVGPCITVFRICAFQRRSSLLWDCQGIWETYCSNGFYSYDRRRSRHYGSSEPGCI